MTAAPFPLFLCCPLKLYSAPGIAGGSPWYNQQKNLGRWIVRPRFFALAESNRQEADCSYDFSIKWLTPFYPANPSQAAGSGEKCMDLRFFAATPLAAETAAE